MEFIKCKAPSANETLYVNFEKVNTVAVQRVALDNYGIYINVTQGSTAVSYVLKDGYATRDDADAALVDFLNENEVKEIS